MWNLSVKELLSHRFRLGLTLLAGAAATHGQAIAMVTHDPIAASYADRVVFLADGRVVDEISEPTVPRVLSHMARLDTPTARKEN